MRDLSGTQLVTEQDKLSATPFVHLSLLSYDTLTEHIFQTTDDPNRVVSIQQNETAYDGNAVITLKNHDNWFTDKKLKGYKATIGWGYVTPAGNEYSDAPPVWVLDQKLVSQEGELRIELNCFDIWGYLAKQVVTGETAGSAPSWQRDTQIIDAIAALILDNTGVVLQDDTAGADPTINYMPWYECQRGDSARNVIVDLIRMTHSVLRMGGDGIMHLIYLDPAATATDYDFITDLSNVVQDSLVTPNRVVFTDIRPTEAVQDDPKYDSMGIADDTESQDAIGIIAAWYEGEIDSTTEAEDRAAAILAAIQRELPKGSIQVQLNCGLELYDYISLTDVRLGSL